MPGQRSCVWTWSLAEGQPTLVFESDELLLEAPNWIDRSNLLVNGAGDLHRLTLAGELQPVGHQGLPSLNNDHVIARSGESVFASANDGQLYEISLLDGASRQITTASGAPGVHHYLHGVNADGQRLAFVGVRALAKGGSSTALYTVSRDGTDYRQLTDGSSAVDGCEFAPDDSWLYYNSEEFDGHAQIARCRPDGTAAEQLTFDDAVNWFPHLSPDGMNAVYLAFPSGTEGHPANLRVQLKLAPGLDWNAPDTVVRIFGGQGSLNVNSWSPDSSAFAFVSYPITPPV